MTQTRPRPTPNGKTGLSLFLLEQKLNILHDLHPEDYQHNKNMSIKILIYIHLAHLPSRLPSPLASSSLSATVQGRVEQGRYYYQKITHCARFMIFMIQMRIPDRNVLTYITEVNVTVSCVIEQSSGTESTLQHIELVIQRQKYVVIQYYQI